MKESQLTDNDRWIMSFYRSSEISGALFFGRIAACVPAGPLQRDLTRHFADESRHSWYWTEALEDLNLRPIRMRNAYQDGYLEAAGLPVNMMEILALTNVFEHRVIAQYARHLKVPGLHSVIKATIEKIVVDEKWHIQWIREALDEMGETYGKETVRQKIQHYRKADKEVYGKALAENESRIKHIIDIRRTHGIME